MSNPTLHERGERFDALLGMIADDGSTPAGQLPAVEYVEALNEAPLGRADEVRQAQAENSGPPDFTGGGS